MNLQPTIRTLGQKALSAFVASLLCASSVTAELPSLVGVPGFYQRGIDDKGWKPLPAQARSPLKLFLLIGDSNMDGRGEIRQDKGDLTPHPRVISINLWQGWENTIEPVHTNKDRSGSGPSLPFGRAYAHMNPDTYVGLVCAAYSGESIGNWAGAPRDDDGWKRLFVEKGGMYNHITDQFDPVWGGAIVLARSGPGANLDQRFPQLADSIRIWLDDPDIPIVVAEQAPFLENDGGEHDEALDRAIQTIPNFYKTNTDDLKSLWEANERSVVEGTPTDSWPWADHFCRESNDSLGARFARAITLYEAGNTATRTQRTYFTTNAISGCGYSIQLLQKSRINHRRVRLFDPRGRIIQDVSNKATTMILLENF